MNIYMIEAGRQCGISDYTQRLRKAIQLQVGDSDIQIDTEYFFQPQRRAITRLKQLFDKTSHYDLVHVQQSIAQFGTFLGIPHGLNIVPLYVLLRLRGMKVLTTMHVVFSARDIKEGIPSRFTNNKPFHILARLYLAVYFRVIGRLSSVVVSLTKSGMFVLQNEYGLRNVMYIPHGLFAPLPQSPLELGKYGILAQDRVLLAFGQAYEAKGYHHLINAMPRVLQHCPNTTLLITGSVAPSTPEVSRIYVQRLKSLIEQLRLESQVRIIGYVPNEDIPLLVNRSDLLLFPYYGRQDASGALAMTLPYGRVPIVSNAPAFDFLEHGKDCVKVENVADVDQMAIAILQILQTPEFKAQIEMNLSSRLSEWSIQNTACAYITLYRQMLA
jgi:glycosyltransferase involved in cell wall biosynthesis